MIKLRINSDIFIEWEQKPYWKDRIPSDLKALGINIIKDKTKTQKKIIISSKIKPLPNSHMTFEGFVPYLGADIGYVQIPKSRFLPLTCKMEEFYNINSQSLLVPLIIHELGHTMGLKHCNSKRCVMAKVNCNNQEKHCWPCLFLQRDLKHLFCTECLSILRDRNFLNT